MALQKSVSTLTLLSSAVAGIIGSGWLMSPLVCVKLAGPASILSWILGGILMMVVASTFVILTRTLPMTGGGVRFFQLTHGHFAGFGFAWISWLAWIAVPPIEMMAIIQYSTNYLPSLMTSSPIPVLTHEGLMTAIFGMILIAGINSMGMQTYKIINYFILAIKLIIPITAIILLLHAQFNAQNFSSPQGFMPFGLQSIFSALPLAGIIYSFIGFNPVVELSAEAKNPKKSIPLSIFGALFICMIIYVFVQFAFIGALPQASLSQGWAHIVFAGDKGPFAGLLTLLGFVFFVKILYFDACISPLGTALAQSVSISRMTYGMCQNGYFPAYFMHTHKNGTPIRAIMLNTLIGLLFFLPFPSWQHMVGFLVSCLVIGYIVGPMALMTLVKQQPELFKPFSQTTIHSICIVAFYICNLLIYWSGWSVVYKIIMLFAIGYALLFGMAFHKKNKKLREKLHFSEGAWVIFYLIGMTAISFCGSFGGMKIIPFGFDFILIACFSASIYAIAYVVTKTH
ncbi:MAG: APC family permease [Coxiellaceae bacterium]|nr:APC family permease [Coxiellaceae bacterium]